MTKHCKLLLSTFALVLSAFSASAATPPKVVFIGDWITYNWTNIAAHPNWINQSTPVYSFGTGGSSYVLAEFQADVVNLHPQIVHIMIGEGDASGTDDANYHLSIPYLLNNLDAIVKEARAADIQVILGLEPPILGITSGGGSNSVGTLNQMNAVIANFGAEHHIPVINYADALCNCVSSTTPSSARDIGYDIFGQYGGGAFLIVPPNPQPFPYDYPLVITPAGYLLMTQMAANAIATLNLTLKCGWLQNIEQSNDNTNSGPVPNVNSAPSPAVIQFTPIGLYSDGSQHPLLNSDYAGSSGRWTSSNPLAVYITQTGLASVLSPGKATIRYTSPDGVRFAEWIMGATAPE